MPQYRVSRYLNVVDLGSTALLFNGVNGCLDEVPQHLADILKAGAKTHLAALKQTDIGTLLKRGHLTTLSPEEELARFREFVSALHKKQELKTHAGGIMLLLSYNCNLACKYCYQQEHRPRKSGAVMSPDLIEDIFDKHLGKMLPGIDHKGLEITFYGGEPFLPAHEPAVHKALEYAAKHDMTASAISNATMVDSMPNIFGDAFGFVNRVQVSLDGTREQHDASRIPPSGTKTFDRIIDNIKLLLERKTRVSIRLNLDRSTIGTVPQLLRELQEKEILGNKYASIYASPLHNNLAEVDASNFIDLTGLSERVLGLGIDLEHPVSLRANEMSYLFSLEEGIGLRHTSFCMQTMQHTLVVDPFGDLYSCFEEAGYPEYRVGRVSTRGVEFFPLHDIYKRRHLANMEECLKCPVALTCGGQCGVRCRAKTGDLFKPDCQNIKQVILAGLKLAYQKKQQQSDEKRRTPHPETFPSTHR